MTDPSKRYWITEQGMKEAAAEILVGKGCCPICGWMLAESADKGCVIGNCSYRTERSEEFHANRRRGDKWEEAYRAIAAHSEAASPPEPQLFSATTTLPDYDATKEIVEGFKSAGINFSTLIWLEREAIAEKAIAPLRAEISRLRELLLPFLAKAAAPPQGTPAGWLTSEQNLERETNLSRNELAKAQVAYQVGGIEAPQGTPTRPAEMKVFDCQANSVTGKNCICTPGWGHQLIRDNALRRMAKCPNCGSYDPKVRFTGRLGAMDVQCTHLWHSTVAAQKEKP